MSVTMTDGRALVRLRANPATLRVSIRRNGHRWTVTVMERGGRHRSTYAIGATPKKAIDRALQKAEEAKLDGVDLGMEWTYEHPQHRREVPA